MGDFFCSVIPGGRKEVDGRFSVKGPQMDTDVFTGDNGIAEVSGMVLVES